MKHYTFSVLKVSAVLDQIIYLNKQNTKSMKVKFLAKNSISQNEAFYCLFAMTPKMVISLIVLTLSAMNFIDCLASTRNVSTKRQIASTSHF